MISTFWKRQNYGDNKKIRLGIDRKGGMIRQVTEAF